MTYIDNAALEISNDCVQSITRKRTADDACPMRKKPRMTALRQNQFRVELELNGSENQKVYNGPTSFPTYAYAFFLAILLTVLAGELVSVYMTLPEFEASKLLEPSFIFAALLIGMGLSLDVKFTTIARSHELDRLDKKLAWICDTTLLHTLFPLIGITLSVFLAQWSTFCMHLLGVVGFALCLWYLTMRCIEFKNTSFVETAAVTENTSVLPSLRQWAVVIGVSLDAFLVGPALASEMYAWSNGQIIAAIPLFGLVVAASVITALLGTQAFFKCSKKKAGFTNCKKIHSIRLFFDLSIVSYFAASAILRFTLTLPIERWEILIFALLSASATTFVLNKLKSAPRPQLVEA